MQLYQRWTANWRSSLKWKLVSVFAAIILCNSVVIGLFVNKEVTTVIERDEVRLSGLVLKQANLNLGRYLQEYERFLMTLGTSQEMTTWTNLSINKKVESLVPYSILQKDQLQPFANVHPEIVSISHYNINENQTFFSPEWAQRIGYSMRNEPWFGEIPVVGNISYHVEESHSYMDSRLNPITIPVVSLIKRFGFKGATYVKIDIRPDLLQSILNEMHLGDNGTGLIVDSSGTIVAHPNKDLFLSPLNQAMTERIQDSAEGAFVLDDTKEIVIYDPVANTDWKSVIILQYDEIAQSIFKIRNVMLATTIICLLLSVALIVFASFSITRRLTKMKQSMKQTGLGKFNVPVPVEGQDEITHLAQSYNTMLEDLQDQIKRLAESKLAEQQSVLFSLQSQIDAHFLYNTLEIINSMASQIQHRDIEEITISLAHMFRYIANNKQAGITINDEVGHLRRYLHIIRIRYRGQFTYNLEMNESCRDAECLKVILQPLAENALKHGLETTGQSIDLSISIRNVEDRHVEVIISDNGKGFDEERLHSLTGELQRKNFQSSNFQRIGLLNIQYRLSTLYTSAEAGLTIGNNSSGGAYVQIVFPYIKSDQQQ
ncbi:cache domain-containing sensor histidine kinase [Paenibacillus radicis (ex Xue et al. 2023)]|uniref:Histidine kinase n=1 Tax=Paenibacillus radicis (ex Xue et al. 2023) TaxID=2972489 RepID=A0ABT1Y9W7_9BACL|nr:histidine kinase [Paenibacillus radicis (ex Xue et al. 2023)]MCR8629971.1 histidine kinase [Paenibacillus radicis (ex Xue et al. 2023)]